MKQDKLYCEKTYLQRVADCYREGSVLNMFYSWLAKKRLKGGKKNNGKETS